METLFILALLVLLVFMWLDGARAREIAVGISNAVCKKNDWQLLDQSVSLRRFGLRWGNQGVRFRRMFGFEYSSEGVERRTGYVVLLGKNLEYVETPQLEKEII